MSSRPCAVTVPVASVATDTIATVALRALMFGLMLGIMVDGNGKGQCPDGYDSPYMTTAHMDELILEFIVDPIVLIDVKEMELWHHELLLPRVARISGMDLPWLHDESRAPR